MLAVDFILSRSRRPIKLRPSFVEQLKLWEKRRQQKEQNLTDAQKNEKELNETVILNTYKNSKRKPEPFDKEEVKFNGTRKVRFSIPLAASTNTEVDEEF